MLRLVVNLFALSFVYGQTQYETPQCPAGTYVFEYAQDGTPICEPCRDTIPECSSVPSNCTSINDPRCGPYTPCIEPYCPEPSTLVFNKYCVWDNTTSPIYKCNAGDIYDAGYMKCLTIYSNNSTACDPNYIHTIYNNDHVCMYSYEPTNDCGDGYIYFNIADYFTCIRVSSPLCSNSTSTSGSIPPCNDGTYDCYSASMTPSPEPPRESSTSTATAKASVEPPRESSTSTATAKPSVEPPRESSTSTATAQQSVEPPRESSTSTATAKPSTEPPRESSTSTATAKPSTEPPRESSTSTATAKPSTEPPRETSTSTATAQPSTEPPRESSTSTATAKPEEKPSTTSTATFRPIEEPTKTSTPTAKPEEKPSTTSTATARIPESKSNTSTPSKTQTPSQTPTPTRTRSVRPSPSSSKTPAFSMSSTTTSSKKPIFTTVLNPCDVDPRSSRCQRPNSLVGAYDMGSMSPLPSPKPPVVPAIPVVERPLPSPWAKPVEFVLPPAELPAYIPATISFPAADPVEFEKPAKIQEIQASLACTLRIPLEKVRVNDITILTISTGEIRKVPINPEDFMMSSQGQVTCLDFSGSVRRLSFRRLQTSDERVDINYVIVQPTADILVLNTAEFTSIITSSPSLQSFSQSVGSTGISTTITAPEAQGFQQQAPAQTQTSSTELPSYAIAIIAVGGACIVAGLTIVGGVKYYRHQKKRKSRTPVSTPGSPVHGLNGRELFVDEYAIAENPRGQKRFKSVQSEKTIFNPIHTARGSAV